MNHYDERLCDVADCYLNGDRGRKQNYEKAMKFYRKAANKGNARAQYNIGYLYHNGLGVTKDFREAFYWFTKAASKDDSLAKEMLEIYYENGFHIWR